MTIIVGVITLVLVVGIIGAVAKRLFKLAMTLAFFALVIVGIAVFVISTMR